MRSYGKTGYDHVVTRFLPLLWERGITEDDTTALTVDNPRRLFSGS